MTLDKRTGPIYAEDCAKVERMWITCLMGEDTVGKTKSLDGIEYFPNLTSFTLYCYCRFALHTSHIEYADFSKNPLLEYLAIAGVHNLNVSQNINLRELNFNGWVTDIDLSNNINLEWVWATGLFTELDVSKT